jgi:hypothetical protein
MFSYRIFIMGLVDYTPRGPGRGKPARGGLLLELRKDEFRLQAGKSMGQDKQ